MKIFRFSVYCLSVTFNSIWESSSYSCLPKTLCRIQYLPCTILWPYRHLRKELCLCLVAGWCHQLLWCKHPSLSSRQASGRGLLFSLFKHTLSIFSSKPPQVIWITHTTFRNPFNRLSLAFSNRETLEGWHLLPKSTELFTESYISFI